MMLRLKVSGTGFTVEMLDQLRSEGAEGMDTLDANAGGSGAIFCMGIEGALAAAKSMRTILGNQGVVTARRPATVTIEDGDAILFEWKLQAGQAGWEPMGRIRTNA